jgi:hypothetical protein
MGGFYAMRGSALTILKTAIDRLFPASFRMNIDFPAFDMLHLSGRNATHPLIRLVERLPLSLVVAGTGLPPPRFALKDSDPLWAKAHVESYAAAARPLAPSGTSNYGF